MRGIANGPRLAAAIGLLLGSTGCGDPLKPLELIEDLRVLGARVEVDGALERANPAPGERATARWLLAAPKVAPSVGWSLEACVLGEGGGSLPSCDGKPFASAASAGPELGAPTLTFDVPAATAADARVLVRGAICPDGAAGPASGGAACEASDLGTRVMLTFALADERHTNLNPELESDSLLFDGTPLAEVDLISDGACERVPEVRAGSGDHLLALRIDEADRDPLVPETSLDPTRESLQITHFSTAGELERAFSASSWAEPAAPVSVIWRAPDSAPAGGLLTRFYLVVRDLRGGSDWLERAVCVVP